MHISTREAPWQGEEGGDISDPGLTPSNSVHAFTGSAEHVGRDRGGVMGGGGGVCLPQAECRLDPSIFPSAQTGKGQAAFAGADSTPRNASAPGRLPTYLVFCTGAS